MQPHATLIEISDYKKGASLSKAILQLQPTPVVEFAPKGKNLVREDDSADHSMLLLEGWVSFSKMLPDGESQIIDVMLPGDFTVIGAASAPKAACSVDALSDVRYINIRPEQANGADSAIAAIASIRELMAGEIVRLQARTAELLLRIGRGSAASRVAYALLEFYVRLESVALVENGSFHFPMTQHCLGEFTGLSNVHVCRTLRRFERDGLISHPSHNRLQLDNIHALSQVAGLDIDTFRKVILRH